MPIPIFLHTYGKIGDDACSICNSSHFSLNFLFRYIPKNNQKSQEDRMAVQKCDDEKSQISNTKTNYAYCPINKTQMNIKGGNPWLRPPPHILWAMPQSFAVLSVYACQCELAEL